MAAINPGRTSQERGPSLLDKINQALEIAARGYGIYAQYQQGEQNEERLDLERQKMQAEADDRARLKRGEFTQQEYAASNLFPANDQPINAKIIGPEGPQLIPSKKQKGISQEDALARIAASNEGRIAAAQASSEASVKKAESLQEMKDKRASDPKVILQNLKGMDKSNVGSIASGFQALDEMSQAMSQGHGPSYVSANTKGIGTFISDTPYTQSERKLNEVIGRLQSQGAINAQEIVTFRQLGPRPGDSAEQQQSKLQSQYDFLSNKLAAYGLKREDLAAHGFKVGGTEAADPKALEEAKKRGLVK